MSAANLARITELRSRIATLRAEVRALAADTPAAVGDYDFETTSGTTTLGALFGAKDDLIVIHNMGRTCAYCTMWADGYNGLYPHIADRASFVLVSPDAPSDQRAFADARGWVFPMVSDRGTTFAADMGYVDARGRTPGISVFRRDGTRIERVATTTCEPHDDFCAAWHLFDLLAGGVGDWRPKLRYR